MVDSTSLLALTRSLEQARAGGLFERWVDRARELESALAMKIISLARYVDELPEDAYESFADALASALADEQFMADLAEDQVIELEPRITAVINRLVERGLNEKAALVREAFEHVTRVKAVDVV
jgi:hypothetical protein